MKRMRQWNGLLLCGMAVAGMSAACVAQSQDSGAKAESKQKSNESHSVKMTQTVENGKESVELWIDGKKIEVKTAEEANKVLAERGLAARFQIMGEGDHVIRLFRGDGNLDVDMDLKGLEELHSGLGRAFRLAPGGGMEGMGGGGAFAFAEPPKAMLGVVLSSIEEGQRAELKLEGDKGVLVSQVLEDTPAAKAGFKDGDVITSVVKDGKDTPVNDEELRELIATLEPGARLEFKVLREGQRHTVTATLGAWDSEKMGISQGFMLNEEGKGGLMPGQGQFQRQRTPGEQGGEHLLQLSPHPQVWQFRQGPGGEGQDRAPMMRGMGQPPEMHEMLMRMEEQMRQMREMIERLQQQQNEMREQLKKVKGFDA